MLPKLFIGLRRQDHQVQVWIFRGKTLVGQLDPLKSLRLFNHSPDGFEWGYHGSGPAQLALALLLETTGCQKHSLQLHQEFKRKFVANLPKDGWILTEREIWDWMDELPPGFSDDPPASPPASPPSPETPG